MGVLALGDNLTSLGDEFKHHQFELKVYDSGVMLRHQFKI